MTTQIDATIHALQGQINHAAAKKGAAIIAHWETDLEKAEWRGAKTIHAELVKLRRHLEGDDLDHAMIAELLVILGESTERAAAHTDDNNKGKLESLGRALVKTGEGLRGLSSNAGKTRD